MYNILLYTGIGLITFGFIGYIVSMLMMRHYDRKLFLLDQEIKRHQKWNIVKDQSVTPTIQQTGSEEPRETKEIKLEL